MHSSMPFIFLSNYVFIFRHTTVQLKEEGVDLGKVRIITYLPTPMITVTLTLTINVNLIPITQP